MYCPSGPQEISEVNFYIFLAVPFSCDSLREISTHCIVVTYFVEPSFGIIRECVVNQNGFAISLQLIRKLVL